MGSVPLPTRDRTEAVLQLFEGLVSFQRALCGRGGQWDQVVTGLTRGDVTTLGVLGAHGPIRPGRVAQVLGVDPSVVSRQLAGLDRLGLVRRDTDPHDGRAELVELTDLGRERLAVARAAVGAVLAERLERWESADLVRATEIVRDLTDRLAHPVVPKDPDA